MALGENFLQRINRSYRSPFRHSFPNVCQGLGNQLAKATVFAGEFSQPRASECRNNLPPNDFANIAVDVG